jgi:hypothetical protein
MAANIAEEYFVRTGKSKVDEANAAFRWGVPRIEPRFELLTAHPS